MRRLSERSRQPPNRFNSFTISNQRQHAGRLQPVAILSYSLIGPGYGRLPRTAALQNANFCVLMSDQTIRFLGLLRLHRFERGAHVFEVFCDQIRRSWRLRRLIHEIVDWAATSEQTTAPNFVWSEFLSSHGVWYQPAAIRLQMFNREENSDSGIESTDDDDSDFQPFSDTDSETDDHE